MDSNQTDSGKENNSETSMTHHSESETDHGEDLYTKFNSTRGWHALILIQFETHTSIALMFGIYISYIYCMITIAIGLGSANDVLTVEEHVPKKMLYAFDMFYFIDFICMMIYKNIKREKAGLEHKPRHGILLLIEFITIIPWAQIYSVIVDAPQSYTFYVLQLRYALRLCRLFWFVKGIRKYVDADSHLLHFIAYVFLLWLIVVTIGCVSYIYECRTENGDCKRNYDILGTQLYLSGVTFFMYGGKRYITSKIVTGVFFSLIPYIINTYFLSYIAVETSQIMRVKFRHMAIFEWLKTRIAKWRQRYKKEWRSYHVKYEQFVDDFARIIWKRTKGYNSSLYLGRVLPRIMYKELYLDTSWTALKHSHLFRNEEVFFLRALAFIMEHKMLCPGEIIYKRNRFKEEMVYVVSGVVDILSEEDGETPILSLAGGTCLGESTLVVSYPSSCTVVAKSICDICVLNRRKFLMLSEQYPEKAMRIKKQVYKRIKTSKRFRNLSLYQQRMQKQSERIGVITMRWLQLTLRKLLSDNARVGDLYDRYYLQSLEENVFCIKYLDLLVKAQDIDLVKDSVFVRNKFPFIFKPDSTLLKTWNAAVLILVIILSVAYPYCVIFSEPVGTEYIILNIIVTDVWIIDLYFKSSTLIQDKYILHSKVSDIIMYNFSSAPYILDILCVIPTEMFLYFVIGKLNKKTAMLVYCNRLLKFYRIELYFRNVRFNMFVHKIWKYVKYALYLVLLTYYTAGIFYVLGREEGNIKAFETYLKTFSAEGIWDVIFLCLSSAVTFFGSMNITDFPYIGSWSSCVVVVVLQMASFMFFSYFMALTIAAHTLVQENNDIIIEFFRDMVVTLKCFNINKELEKRIWCYINMQLQISHIYFLIGNKMLNFLPRDLLVISFGIGNGDLIRHQHLFFELNDQILSKISSVATVHVLPSTEIIKNAGEICTEIHILANGQCSVMCINGQSKTVLPGECFSILDCSLNVPSLVTVRAITNCKIVSINFYKFKAILLEYPQEYEAFQNTVRYINTLEVNKRIKNNNVNHDIKIPISKQLNIRSFGYVMKKRTKEYFTFHDGFPRWAFILKYLLMRNTFYCNGNFVLYWEIGRCIIALVTCFLFPFTILHTDPLSPLHVVICFFDVTAYVDIYLRHHYSYYNEDGLEITHPFKTATFYWRHAFLIDLLGCMPIYTLGQLIIRIRHEMLYFLNRLIQLYRFQALKRIILRNKIQVKSAFTLLTYLPYLIIACNVIASWVFFAICQVNTYRVQCASHSWIRNVTENMTKHQVYSHTVLFTISGMVYNSFGIIRVRTPRELTWFIVSVSFGLFIQVYLVAVVVSSSFSINRDLVSYQEAMQQLVKFLSYRKIDKNIKNEIVNHFEYMWYKSKGKSIQTTFKPFKTSFKIEALYNIYGSIFKQSSIFPEPNQSFFKSLLLDIKHEIYLKTGILYSVNDVNGDIFFLLKGKVAVVGADLNKLLTLQIGSVFGNLDNCPIGRRTLTMVASGHVEVLKISSSNFYYHLLRFPYIRKHFMKLTLFNVDFLEEKRRSLEFKQTTFEVVNEPRPRVKTAMLKRKRRKIFVKNKFILFWEDVFLNIMYYLNYLFELYHMSTGDDSHVMTFFLYTFDFIYILKIYFKFHTTFENEFGQVIDDHRAIARHYMKDKLGFYFDISTVLPFELISLFFPNTSYQRFIWAGLRINRIPRIILLFLYFKEHSQMLNINVFTIRTIFLLVKITTAQVTLGAIITLVRNKPEGGLIRIHEFLDSVKMITNSCSKFSFDLKNLNETYWVGFLAIVLVFTSKYITWYFIAQTCSLLYVVNYSRSNYEQFIIFMNRYMENESVSVPLAKQITLFTKLLWSHTSGNLFPRLLDEAPYYLKEAVLNSMFGFHLLEHPLLRHCHKDLMRQMTSHMKTLVFFPGDTVVYAGDIDNSMYFIHEGEIRVIGEDTMCSEVVESVLRGGDMFGLDQGLYERRGHDYTYRVSKRSVLIALKRDDWIYLLDFFPASKRVVYDKTAAS